MSEQSQGKGRPTPKRSEATKRRGGPVPPPPTSRRQAAKQVRAKQAANRKNVRAGSKRGDEAVLLRRDQGPVRKFVRTYVDSRRTLAWILLPIALLVVVSGFAGNERLQALIFSIWLASFFAVAIEMMIVGVQLRRSLRRTFTEEGRVAGHVFYGLMRTTVLRRWRVPRAAPRS